MALAIAGGLRWEFAGRPVVFSSKCVGVNDGDTIRVIFAGREERVRLYGIDCPEKGQPYSSKAKQFTSSLVFGRTVNVRVVERDRYGRAVAWVTTEDGKNVNAMLVEAGLAWWYRKYAPNNALLSKAEKDARNAKRGVWQETNPTPPWDYRLQRSGFGNGAGYWSGMIKTSSPSIASTEPPLRRTFSLA